MNQVGQKKIADEFAQHPSSPEKVQSFNEVRQKFDELLGLIESRINPANGRYLSIVKMKLEEACMFTGKGIFKE